MQGVVGSGHNTCVGRGHGPQNSKEELTKQAFIQNGYGNTCYIEHRSSQKRTTMTLSPWCKLEQEEIWFELS